MRGSHGALVVIAVGQVQRVADLVDRFLQQPLSQDVYVRGQPVKLLPQPMGGHQPARPADLCFTENKRQDGNVEIYLGDPEHSPGICPNLALHGMQNLRRVELLSFAMVGKLRIQAQGQHLGGYPEEIRHGGSQIP